MKLIMVIPARMASTRFPGKPLVDLGGKPMIQWVYEAALASQVGQQVLIATPDPEIIEASRKFGGEAVLTRNDHPSGTDRIAEVSERCEADFYINVQGDEPLIQTSTIRACALALEEPGVQMSSVWTECPDAEIDSPSTVKVVCTRAGDALYFSRYPIPFARNEHPMGVRKHVGIYGYSSEVLRRFKHWPIGDLEQAESLEQLRFLENGVRIRMAKGDATQGVDTPEQALQVASFLAQR